MANSKIDDLWSDASREYARVSGKELEDLPKPRGADELIHSVDLQNEEFKHFREKRQTLLSALDAAVRPVEALGQMVADTAGEVFPPSACVFGAAMHLINAARGVSASLDAIVDLLDSLKDFTVRVKVYTRVEMSQELRHKLTEIMVTMVEVFAHSTKKVQQGFRGRLKSFGKNLVLGNDEKLQDLLAKLERLTRSEESLAGAETLNRKAIGKIADAMEASKIYAREDRDLKYVEQIHDLLQPSFVAQDRLDEIRREHLPGSGDWIWSEEAYQNWIDFGGQPILWISGNPGCGKSFLAYSIISHLQFPGSSSSDRPFDDTSVAYFFLRRGKISSRSIQQALCDVAYQLSQKDPVFARYIATTVSSSARISTLRMAWLVMFQRFWLNDKGTSRAYVVLDGLDEATVEDRNTFFDLLQDVNKAGTGSRLHIILVGRPPVIDNLIDGLGGRPPTIHIDASRNGHDIARYIEVSIRDSRRLSRLPADFKQEIVATLQEKAEGMFMWARLMIAELGRRARRGRQSTVEDALYEAPTGLTEMIWHILEGFSSRLTPMEASDLNDMLMWGASAERCLSLGELDDLLRLKSQTGDGVLDLESNLRHGYSSLFTLTREDGLTTAELLDRSHSFDHGDADPPDAADRVFEDDHDDSITSFGSNPDTTFVSFAHTSISDFLRDTAHGKVKSQRDHESPAVGVDSGPAQITVSKTCVRIISDNDFRNRMKEPASLRDYAGGHWIDHLKAADAAHASAADMASIGTALASMLTDESVYPAWLFYCTHLFFTAESAEAILPWLKDSRVLEAVPSETAQLIESMKDGEALEIFQASVQYIARVWLAPVESEEGIKGGLGPIIVHSWLARRKGQSCQDEPRLTAEEILEAAEWRGLECNAMWHHRVAIALRDHEHWEDARGQFERAMELAAGFWRARLEFARMLCSRESFGESIALLATNLEILDRSPEGQETLAGKYWSHRYLGHCYDGLTERGSMATDEHDYETMIKALQHFKRAFELDSTDHEVLTICIDLWGYLASIASPDNNASQAPSRDACYKHIMELAHDLFDSRHEDGSTAFMRCVFENEYNDDFIFICIAEAARETGELEWLQARYRDAIIFAQQELRSVKAACLSICLADLYFIHGDNEEAALRIWESVGLEGVLDARMETGIMHARRSAMDALGEYCVRKALEDEDASSQWIERLEKVIEKQQRRGELTRTDNDSLPLSDIALFLATWYSHDGREQDARDLVRPHVETALAILADEDPSNHEVGYTILSDAFLATRSDANALALLQSPTSNSIPSPSYQISEDVGITPDSGPDVDKSNDGSSSSSVLTASLSDEDSIASIFSTWLCDGPCGRIYHSRTGASCCYFDFCEFCPRCFALLQEDAMPFRMCSATHKFLSIPSVHTELSQDEIWMDGKIVERTDWLGRVRQMYGL